MGRGREALERVLRIAPQGDNQSHAVARSSLVLVREYLRRVAKSAELSGQAGGMTARDALRADLAGLLLPELVLSPELAAGLAGLRFHGSILTRVAAHYIRWEAAAGHAALVDSGMWEPYEPLIRLLERGGELSHTTGSSTSSTGRASCLASCGRSPGCRRYSTCTPASWTRSTAPGSKESPYPSLHRTWRHQLIPGP